MNKSERSVLYAVYELLPIKLQSRFFILSSRIWYDHYTNIPTNKVDQKKAYVIYADKQRKILNELLARVWEL